MTTYKTGNPIGSADPKDLYDNSQNFDQFLLAGVDTYEDRLGRLCLTLEGALRRGTPVVFANRQDMNADTTRPVGVWAIVVNDLIAGNNGYYIRTAGGWARTSLQPAAINSPAFTGVPTAPSAGLIYETSSQIANVNTVLALTRAHRSVPLEYDANGIVTLTLEQSRMPVVAFTGTAGRDVIVEIPTDATGMSRTFRNAAVGTGTVTVRHTGQSTGVLLRSGDIVFTVSNGSSVLLAGVSPERYRSLLDSVSKIESRGVNTPGLEQIRYVGQHQLEKLYKKGAAVKFAGDYFYADNLDQVSKNEILNPRFNQNGSGWQGLGNRVIQRGDGIYRVSMTGDKAPGALLVGQSESQGVGTHAGEVWSASVRVENKSATSFSVQLGLFFAGSTVVYSSDVLVPAGQSVLVEHNNVPATPGSSSARITLNNSAVGVITDGTEIVVSQPVLCRGAVALEYFDGSFERDGEITYSWSGAIDNSISVKTLSIPESVLGIPGVDQRWIRYLSDVESSEGGNSPLGTYTPVVTEKATTQIACFMTRDRTIGFNWGSSTLNMTFDDGDTWELLHNFAGAQTTFVRELENGELLVGLSKTGPAEVWVSSGFRKGGAVTWSKVLESHSTYTNFAAAWGVFDDGNMVLLIDYGGKAGMPFGNTDVVPDGENARYAYMSLDHGKTWKTIFDLNEWALSNGYATLDDDGVPQARGFHCHGIAYDKWWDRMWITFGDNATVGGINSCGGMCYSDDFGKTWRAANWGKDSQHLSPSGSRHQLVGIWPMPDCILFGSDSSPNGVHRIERSQGKHIPGEYIINVAFAYSDEEILTHLCQGIYQATHLPGQPVFFVFGAEGAIRKSFIVATRDGFDFKLMWESPEPNARGNGLRLIAGPTRQGQLLTRLTDTIDGVLRHFQVRGPAPIY
ncbi:hypothetical protein [Alcaligenes faecalis]|uniref:Exo-alpha-sialidase n=1 Tax=Alcaligenes faecalis TaxID=511 RepID=A0ABY7N7E3_ALCFA|nr:hypothetical protein [Alcaligenes faecalis]WBM40048.1 hypothetical protein M2J83_09620 [Alcaligenes faecalis]